MRSLLAIAVALVTFAVADASGQFGGRPPSGSYTRSCSKATMVGSVLTAECKEQNGEMIVTRLYVRDCSGDISNVFGELQCSGRYLPPGSYAATCSSCRAVGSALACTCQDKKQAPIKTTLDLASCDWNSRITNKDGHLQCE